MNWLSHWEVESVLPRLEEQPPRALCLPGFRQRACSATFFSLMPSEKMSGRRGGAAWLTSCALVFHRPSQWLPFTEVSVTADLLSHFDLIVASEGAWPRAPAESHLLVVRNARASVLKEKETQGPRDFLPNSESLLRPAKCIRYLSPLAALSHGTASLRDLRSCWSA